MEQTKVVNIKKEPYQYYIGRGSKYGNPFKIDENNTREDVIVKYEHYIRNNEQLMNDIQELNGLVLGCYCKPLSCHGDVIIKIIGEINATQNKEEY